jgi:hypothetical protein
MTVATKKVANKVASLPDRKEYLARGAEVPGHLWGSSFKIKLTPSSFKTQEKDGLNTIMYGAEAQEEMLQSFVEDPTLPRVYMLSSMPNDEVSSVVAAFLMGVFIKKTPPSELVYWSRVKWGSFDTRVFNSKPSMLVLTGISPVTSSTRLEYVQEVIDFHRGSIPIIIAGTGVDPITMSATKLFRKPTSYFFQSSALVKRDVEII